MGSIRLVNRFSDAEKREMAKKLKAIMVSGNLPVLSIREIAEQLQQDLPPEKRIDLHNRDRIMRLLKNYLTKTEAGEFWAASFPKGGQPRGERTPRGPASMSPLTTSEREKLADEYVKTPETLTRTQRLQMAMRNSLSVEKHRPPSSFYMCQWWEIHLANAEARKRVAELQPQEIATPEEVDKIINLTPSDTQEIRVTELQYAPEQVAFNANDYLREIPTAPEPTSTPLPLKVSFEDLLAESLANMFVKAAKLALPTVMKLLTGEMQEHLSQPEELQVHDGRDEYIRRHNPLPTSGTKEKKPNVLIVGLMPSKKQLIHEKFGDKFDLRFWCMDQTDSLLQQATESADAAMIMTGYIKHKHTQIVSDRFKKRDANDMVTLIASGPKELEDRLRHLSNRFLQ